MRPFCAVDCENVLRGFSCSEKQVAKWWMFVLGYLSYCLTLQLEEWGIKKETKRLQSTARVDTCVFPHSTRVQECVRESCCCNLTSGRWANSLQSINQSPMQIWYEPGKDRSFDYTSSHADLKVLRWDSLTVSVLNSAQAHIQYPSHSFSKGFQDTGDFMWQVFLSVLPQLVSEMFQKFPCLLFTRAEC